MHRDRNAKGTREHIAHLAARLMAQDHIDDFALAKRKAAHQLGLPQGKNLPTNQEVEAALREYRGIYQPEHDNALNALRQKALVVMKRFQEFRPYLTGSVLSGLAGPHSDINLVVYTDNPKSIEIFCLNQGIAFRSDLRRGDDDYPTLTFVADETVVRLSVRPIKEERQSARAQGQQMPERARLAQVQALLDATPTVE
ncbi:nucleotidyltransferase domain-containing protein [Chitinimonas lacunae]|uniref:Nucleotidyltransferase domain-containing protein n=1 Tax=Chitinimonas lacunae TaxID=1963018 RepID=A0ABV8MPX2_9NEIS